MLAEIHKLTISVLVCAATLYVLLYYLLYVLDNTQIKFTSKLAKIFSSISLSWTICFFTSPTAPSADMPYWVELFTVLAMLFSVFYYGNAFKKTGEVEKQLLSLYLLLIGWLVVSASCFILSLKLINIGTNEMMACGFIITVLLLSYIFIWALHLKINSYVKVIIMLAIYCVVIFYITLVCAPLSTQELISQNAKPFELFYISLQNSYTLSLFSEIKEVNVVHLLQFTFCKIFDVLILGTIINVLTEVSKRKHKRVHCRLKRLKDKTCL